MIRALSCRVAALPLPPFMTPSQPRALVLGAKRRAARSRHWSRGPKPRIERADPLFEETRAMTFDDALAWLDSLADPALAEQAKDTHQVERRYLGIRPAALTEAARDWREALDLDARLDLGRQLWGTDIFEARLLALKLFVQARIRPDDTAVWEQVLAWLPEIDTPALAEQIAEVGARRVAADPSRLETLATFIAAPNPWTRRAALGFTQFYARLNNLKPQEQEARAQVLAWAGVLIADRDHLTQKAIGLWLRDLSKHDPLSVQDFLTGPGATLKSFARKIARSYLE